MGVVVVFILGVEYWLKCYDYLFVNYGVVYGVNYIDIYWCLFVEIGLVIFSMAIVIWLGWLSVKGWFRVKGIGVF